MGHETGHLNSWAQVPIEIESLQFLTNFPELCLKMNAMESRMRLVSNTGEHPFYPGKQLCGKNSSHDDKYKRKLSAFSLNPEGLIKMQVPGSVTLTRFDGILSYGPRSLAGHIKK